MLVRPPVSHSSLFTRSLYVKPRFTTSRLARCLATLAEGTPSSSTFRIPVVDFSKYTNASNITEKRQAADEVVTAFKEVGFVYLSNHGISDRIISNVFQKSKDFFALPSEVKDNLAWVDPRSNRGYVATGRERVTQASDAKEIAKLREKAPDSKETMEIGRDWDAIWKNQWPTEANAPGFKQSMLDFFQTCHHLHRVVMRSIALGLDLHESYFDDKIDGQYHNLRLLSYPPIRTEILKKEGQARAGSHSGWRIQSNGYKLLLTHRSGSDYGTLTLLFQDQVGGLEVQNPHTKEFQPATPIPGTIVVNVGDLLSRWSNDVLRSTLHRVVAPPATKINDHEQITPGRQSVAFFCNPNHSTRIECLPNCVSAGERPKYDPVTTEQYIVRRLSETYV